jgi:hypothetical protein
LQKNNNKSCKKTLTSFKKRHQPTPKFYTKGTTIGIGGFKNSTVVKMINNPKGSYAYNSLEEAWLSWSCKHPLVKRHHQ